MSLLTRARMATGTAGAALAFAFASPTAADQVTVSPVDFDRWMYPFNATPGIRNVASTFAAIDDPEFDDKDGQVIVAVDTVAAGIPAGLAPDDYDVQSISLRLTHFSGDFLYDPTYDAWQTYLEVGEPGQLDDTDPGRPLELYGVGLRGGYTAVVIDDDASGPPLFGEMESFGGTTGVALRPAYPLDFGTPNAEDDVSNNVREGFDPVPWAIGLSTSGLAPGDRVPEGVPGVSAGETFEFAIDLSDPAVVDYVQDGLAAGVLAFAVVSMTETVQQAGGTNPNYYLKDNFDPAAVKPSLTIDVELPPECSDGIDNDEDGEIDFPDDLGCRDARWIEAPQCQDGIDNDEDGLIDFDGGAWVNGGTPLGPAEAVDCTSFFDNGEVKAKRCGMIGFEGLAAFSLLALRRRLGRRRG